MDRRWVIVESSVDQAEGGERESRTYRPVPSGTAHAPVRGGLGVTPSPLRQCRLRTFRRAVFDCCQLKPKRRARGAAIGPADACLRERGAVCSASIKRRQPPGAVAAPRSFLSTRARFPPTAAPERKVLMPAKRAGTLRI